MNEKKMQSSGSKISPNAALGIGIAAGFAFLIGMGAALKVLSGDLVPLFCFGLILFVSLSLLLSRRQD